MVDLDDLLEVARPVFEELNWDVGLYEITEDGVVTDDDVVSRDGWIARAVEVLERVNVQVVNVDVTVVCEAPKIGPHASAMQARLADIMGVEVGSVSVKATTSERLGFTGRGEGIAALATAALTGQR